MKTDKTVIGDAIIWWRFGQPIAFHTEATGTVVREGTPYGLVKMATYYTEPVDEFNRLYDEAIANKLKETI